MFLVLGFCSRRRKGEYKGRSVERTGSVWKRCFWSHNGSVKGKMVVTLVLKPENEC